MQLSNLNPKNLKTFLSSNQHLIFSGFLIMALMISTQGHCAEYDADMEKTAKGFIDILNSSWLKAPILTATGIGSLIASGKANSIIPFCLWGVIAASWSFLKPLINLLSHLGS